MLGKPEVAMHLNRAASMPSDKLRAGGPAHQKYNPKLAALQAKVEESQRVAADRQASTEPGAKKKLTFERPDRKAYTAFVDQGLKPAERKVLGNISGLDIGRR